MPALSDVTSGRTLFDGYGRRLSAKELALLPSLDLVLEGEEEEEEEGGKEGGKKGRKEVVLMLTPAEYLHNEVSRREGGRERGRGSVASTEITSSLTILPLPPSLPPSSPQGGFYFLKIIRYGHWAIGQTFLRTRYLEIDRARKRVGFAMPVPGCVPPSLPPSSP